mgnify:CR=1 FL=1
MKIQKFDQYLNEDLLTDVNDKLSDENKDIKEDLTKMIQKSINSDDMGVFIEKLDSIIRNPNESSIEGLIQDAQIYDFYLKYRNEVDETLTKIKFFDDLQKFQKDNTVISLYDFVTKGTKRAINDFVTQIKQDLSQEEGGE